METLGEMSERRRNRPEKMLRLIRGGGVRAKGTRPSQGDAERRRGTSWEVTGTRRKNDLERNLKKNWRLVRRYGVRSIH